MLHVHLVNSKGWEFVNLFYILSRVVEYFCLILRSNHCLMNITWANQSDTASVRIPELELELTSGTLGGVVTTVEGLITKISESEFLLTRIDILYGL